MIEIPKKRLQVTLKENAVGWIDKQVMGLMFASRSHAVEYAMQLLMKNEEKLSEIIPMKA